MIPFYKVRKEYKILQSDWLINLDQMLSKNFIPVTMYEVTLLCITSRTRTHNCEKSIHE